MSDVHEFTPGLGGVPVTMLKTPHGLQEIIDFYGNPDADGDMVPDHRWEEEFIIGVSLPFPMRLSWNPSRVIRRVAVNRLCAKAMMGALETFRDRVGAELIAANGWDHFGGIYNVRMKAGSRDQYSIHSWGAAIDVNPHLGPMHKPPQQPLQLVEAFEAAGAEWGGDWPSMNAAWPYDGMHWQFATGY